MVTSKVLKHIIQHWIDFKNSDAIVKPAFGIIAGLMARHPNYKKHLLAADNEFLRGLSILANHNDLNKFYTMSVIQLASMRAIENRYQNVVQHIQQLIDGKAIEMCVQSLQTDGSMKVKKSALNAIIVAVYKASDDQRDSIGRVLWDQNGWRSALLSQYQRKELSRTPHLACSACLSPPDTPPERQITLYQFVCIVLRADPIPIGSSVGPIDMRQYLSILLLLLLRVIGLVGK
ncbi:unnamed protein product [Medioppia subpectinata]|uniref:Uncharacterized protein n=1 Tax=Medioppia subpectinata TaxID=1979941 RepID=A0A7R9KJX3_9ACAR|nr:unnamed protein product [Medioppia subpectinata]CAG2104909.1 unnamed protein product [Medioppia subpectinata]